MSSVREFLTKAILFTFTDSAQLSAWPLGSKIEECTSEAKSRANSGLDGEIMFAALVPQSISQGVNIHHELARFKAHTTTVVGEPGSELRLQTRSLQGMHLGTDPKRLRQGLW